MAGTEAAKEWLEYCGQICHFTFPVMNQSKGFTIMMPAIKCASAGILVALLLTLSQFATASQHPENETTAEEVTQEIAETYQVLKNYTVEQRDKALATAEKKLAELDRQIDRLQGRIDNGWQSMSKTGRQQARETLQALQRQREKVAEWYGGLQHGSAEAWEEIKRGFTDSYDRLEKAFNKAKKDLRDES